MTNESSSAALQAAVGYRFEPTTFTYDEKDVALYALSVGAAADPLAQGQSRYVYELDPAGFRALPSFAAVYPLGALAQIGDIPGLNLNLTEVLHGEHFLAVDGLLPVAATVRSEAYIDAVFDKGSGALLVIAVDSFDEQGRHLALNRAGIFVRGRGNFGGERGPAPGGEPPARPADARLYTPTQPNQAQFYRLTSGDRNPLHADPRFAALLGFDRPILHGLATYAFATRAVLQQYAGDDPARLRTIKARFAAHVFPGETVATEMWQTGTDEVTFRSTVVERETAVLTHGVATLHGGSVAPQMATAVPRSRAIFAEINERIAAHPEWLEQVGAVYQFEISGPEGGSYVVDLLNNPGAARPGADPDAACRLAMSYEDFWAMLKGELKPEMAFLSGKLQVSGSAMLALKLGPLFDQR